MNIVSIVKSTISLLALLGLSFCTTAPKGDIPSSANPREEIGKLSVDLNLARETHVDVLDRKNYLVSRKYLETAKDYLANGKDQEKVLNELRFGRLALKKAQTNSEKRRDLVPALLSARDQANQAGAPRSLLLRKEWENLDEDVGSKARNFEGLSSGALTKLENRYIDLAKKATTERELGNAQSKTNGSREAGAAKRSPLALRKSEISMQTAVNAIGANIKSPIEYRDAVAVAVYDAQVLTDIVDIQRKSGNSLSEEAATKIVLQTAQIGNLKRDLSSAEDEVAEGESKLKDSDQALERKEAALLQRDRALGKAQERVNLQAAIEKSRKEFSNQEAEAFQQGDNLLIRLKSMKFKSGRAELPGSSLSLLSKVSAMAKSLNAKQIKVEGHTDSLGTELSNQKLSELRGDAVAKYFTANGFTAEQVSSEGLGYAHPIATNKSRDGREQNRRVDIIIVPQKAGSSVQ